MPEQVSQLSDTVRRALDPFRQAFLSRRVAFMIPLGFASGLPLMLTGSTLTAWMDSVGVELATIGIFAWASLPYNFKFVWAPLLDRYRLPWLSRRRDWMVAVQLGLMGAIMLLGCLDPVRIPTWVAVVALMVAFLSASQDIVIDAYRTDLLPAKERASGVAVFVAIYRLALIVAGAGALILSDYLSWRVVYLILAGLMFIGVVGTLLAPRVPASAGRVRTLREAVVEPLRDFFSRPHAVWLLIVVMTYKVGDSVASQMMMPFLLNPDHGMGFGRAEVGAIVKGLGLGASIGGALIGGGLTAKLGLRPALILFGLLQAVANVLYVVLALVGRDHTMLVAAIGVDNLCNGLGTAAFVAFMMALCNAKFSATQYALLSSSSTLVGRLLSGASGWIAEQVGWPVFFLITLVAAAPALLLLIRVPLKIDNGEETSPGEA